MIFLLIFYFIHHRMDDIHGKTSVGEKSCDRLEFFDIRPVFFVFQRPPLDSSRFGGPFGVAFIHPPVFFHGLFDNVLGNAFALQFENGLESSDASRFEVVDVVCGELRVILINHGLEVFRVEPGMRIAQLVVAPVLRVETSLVDSLDDTARGTGGFGSTGA